MAVDKNGNVQPVVVQFFKYPDIPHWGHEGFIVGDDEYGTWVSSPAGSRRWRGEVEFDPLPHPAVMCAPHDGWWHLYYNGSGGRSMTHFVDITTQPVRVGIGRIEMVDLDLDVVRRLDGGVEIVDEDEFLLHQVRYGYPPEIIRRAREEADRIYGAVIAREEPFFEVAESWLQIARSS